MKDQGTRGRNDTETANPDEVRSAVQALKFEELRRLDKYARWRIRGLGRASMGRTHEDLLQDAITATLGGNRHWSKSVDFVKHLREAMRSISTTWRKVFDPNEAHLASEVIEKTPEGRMKNPMDQVCSPVLNPEQTLAMKEKLLDVEEKLTWIEKLVADDPLASLIVEGLREGMTGPTIQDALGVSKTEYETKMKWLYRTARRAVTMRRSRA